MLTQHIWFGQSGDQQARGLPVCEICPYINTSTAAFRAHGGTWTNSSDRDRKENFRDEDGEAVLERIARLPIPSWTYKAQDTSIRHLGPMSQDCYAAFGLGQDDLTIATNDISGVPALEQRTRDLGALRAELAEAEAERGLMQQRLAVLEAALARLEAVTEANQR